LNSSRLESNSPPSIFIGSKLKYPLVNVGIIKPLEKEIMLKFTTMLDIGQTIISNTAGFKFKKQLVKFKIPIKC